MQSVLTADILLAAYSQGIFPMADDAQSEFVHWVCPEMRGQLSITGLHVPRRLKKVVRQMRLKGRFYEIKINSDFEAVMRCCGEQTRERQETWINDQIITAYTDLHKMGHAHSVECWQDGALIGGLYGVAIGGAFFGESMFSRQSGASKVALVHLAARLYHTGYKVLDTQFTNPHLEQFGIYEVPHQDYIENLQSVLGGECAFSEAPSDRVLIKEYLEALERYSNVSS